MGTRGEAMALMRAALTLGRRARLRNPAWRRLPALLFVTDPGRVRDPLAAVRRLPQGAGVVYRAFGRADALDTGLALATLCRSRGLILLVGDDEALAARIGAAGLHLPERGLIRARAIRVRRPLWMLTGAAHSRAALAKAAAVGLDAALVSPVFPSRSPSAGRPLGRLRFAGLVRTARLPVYALGGIDPRTAQGLAGTGAAGLAAVEALK